MRLDARIGSISVPFIEKPIRQFAATFERRVRHEQNAVGRGSAGEQFGIDVLGTALVDPNPIDRFRLHLGGALLERLEGRRRNAVADPGRVMRDAERVDRAGAAGHHDGFCRKECERDSAGTEFALLRY